MLQGASHFLEGILESWNEEPESHDEIDSHEFAEILDHISESAGKFFSEGVKITLNVGGDVLTVVGGVFQAMAGLAMLPTPDAPLGVVLLYQSAGNIGGGVSSLINDTAGTHYDWNVTKKLDQIILGKKNGTIAFEAMDLGSSFFGMLRLEVITNDFGMPILKLWRHTPEDFVRGIKNMTRFGLGVELYSDGSTSSSLWGDLNKK